MTHGKSRVSPLIALLTLPVACGGSPRATGTMGNADSGTAVVAAGAASTGGARSAAGAASIGGASGIAGATSGGGESATGGVIGSGGGAIESGGAGGGFWDGGPLHPSADSGAACVPGTPCEWSEPGHVASILCDSDGLTRCHNYGFAADGAYCGVHGTCLAGSCVETTPCNVSYSCPAAQTCWTKDGVRFDCMADGSGKVGDACNPSVFATVTCGDGLACLGTATVPGKCVAWCSSAPCPSDKTCTSIPTTTNLMLAFCL